MAKGSIALLLGILAVVLGPAAGAQALEEYEGVRVSPATILTPDTEVTVSGPAFPNQTGCRPGTLLGIPDGGGVDDGVPLITGDLNTPVTEDGRWELTFLASFVPLAATTYTIYLDCKEAFLEQTYTTEAQFTVTRTATTIPTTTTTSTVQPGLTQAPTTTTTAPPGTQGTVDPTTAKPGETTITIRGGGFKPGAALQISLGTTPPFALGTTTATDSGAYAATLKLPVATPPGTHQLVVTGSGPDDVSRSTTATLTVQDLDCEDFVPPTAAQAALAGGRDPHGLDADKDGIACEAESTRTGAGSGSGGGGGSGAQAAAAPGGSLPQTGTDRSSVGVMAGLTAMTLGALLVGLSHPAVPASGRHRRRRPGRR